MVMLRAIRACIVRTRYHIYHFVYINLFNMGKNSDQHRIELDLSCVLIIIVTIIALKLTYIYTKYDIVVK